MSKTHKLASVVTCVVTPFLAACVTDYREETDHEARWYDLRIRREFDGVDDHRGSSLEASWARVEGSENDLDYTIDTVDVGVGLDASVGERGWCGIVAGLTWQGIELETPNEGREYDGSLGPYVALQGGWAVTPWLEPYARGELGVTFPDASSTIGAEVGLRFPVDDTVTPYVMWRFVRFHVNDFDHLASIDQLELDASGLVVGLQLRF